MVYLIEVGHHSRKGTFNKLHEKAVLVDDGSTFYDVKKHFEGKYEGFDVIVKEVKPEPIKVNEHHANNDEAPEEQFPIPQSSIDGFRIEYTEEEEKLYKEYASAKHNAKKLLYSLHDSIRDRYAKLFYSNTGRYEMELETDDYGTVCLKFPVRAKLFAEAAKECDGTIPAETEPPAGEERSGLDVSLEDRDIPF